MPKNRISKCSKNFLSKKKIIKTVLPRITKMVQRLRAHIVLAEGLNSILSTHIADPGVQCPLLTLTPGMPMLNRYMYKQNSNTYKQINNQTTKNYATQRNTAPRGKKIAIPHYLLLVILCSQAPISVF